MKIAFATIYDGRDVRRGSGTFYYMSREIERHGHKVFHIGPVEIIIPAVSRIIASIHRRAKRRYKTFLDPFVARRVGQVIAHKLNQVDIEILLTNDFGIAGYTKTSKPIVLYTDQMIPQDYPNNVPDNSRISNLSLLSAKLCQHTIKKGLMRSDLCVFPAEWSANEALKYSIKPSKVRVIPFGANIEDPGRQIAAARSFSRIVRKGRIDLLFVGKDWVRKGGDLVVSLTNELRRLGINAILHIAGTTPPLSVDSDIVKVYGMLDKSVKSERSLLDLLYRTCDVLVLPSSSEGFGIVALEAASYGMPTLAYNVDGVRSAVQNGKSGILMAPGQTELDFADRFQEWFANPDSYKQLVQGSRSHYEESVNWKKCVGDLLREIHAAFADTGFDEKSH